MKSPLATEMIGLERLIDRWVEVDGHASNDAIGLKIEVLSLALEKLRHARKQKGEQITFEEFEQSILFPDTDCLRLIADQLHYDVGKGTAPVRLQVPLLLFLLVHHRERLSVLAIIDLFIDKIWDDLTFVDFKKTATGVTRCYTNTRFAAHTLRDYGFLKFTQKEAFKTWELSLTGFLVAARVLAYFRGKEIQWNVPIHTPHQNFDLHEQIRQAWDGLRSYTEFVERLKSIFIPDAKIFTTFGPVLQEAYKLLPAYWDTLGDHELTQKDRRRDTQALVHELEAVGLNDDFYAELSDCIKINDALAKATSDAKAQTQQGELPL
jgi:hypothetical protein